MTKFEKARLAVLFVLGVAFLILFYLNGLNGRYQRLGDSRAMIDTRTGNIYSLEGKQKLN